MPQGGRGPLLKNGNEATDVVTKNFLSGELQQLRRDMRQLGGDLPENAPDPVAALRWARARRQDNLIAL